MRLVENNSDSEQKKNRYVESYLSFCRLYKRINNRSVHRN